MDNQTITISLDGIKAAIFDMDGTMVNNMAFHKKAWQAFLKKYHILLSDEDFDKKISGKKNNEIFSITFGQAVSLEDEAKYTQEKEAMYRELYAEAITEVPGLTSVISQLKNKGLKLAIATTATKENREFVLKALQLEGVFDVILGDEDVTQGKPHPGIYLKAAEMLGTRPSECIVFEDSPPGVASAKSAGMTVIGILTTHSKDDLRQADYVVSDFAHISFAEGNLSRDEVIIEQLLKNGIFAEVGNSLDDGSLVEFILAEIKRKYIGKPLIVTLTGGPGGGKSTLKNELIRRLEKDGHPSDFVSTDDFGLYSREERNKLIKEGKINPWTAKDWNLLNEIVSEVRKGNGVKAPVYNEQTGDAVVIGKENFPHVIPANLHFLFVEGDFQPVENPDIQIYFHVPTDVRRMNRVNRDMQKRNGGDAEKIRESFDFRLESQYYPYTLPNAEKADILIVTKAIPLPVNDGYIYEYVVYK